MSRTRNSSSANRLASMRRHSLFHYGCAVLFLLVTLLLPVGGLLAQSQAEVAFSKMTLEEKIAQLLIVRVTSTGSAAENQKMLENIAKSQPGGVCFFKGGPVREASITNQMQAVSKVPMFISIDGEWGPAMRLDSCVEFPRQMTLGALPDDYDSLIYQMGFEIAKQCKAVGVNLNFAPCVDINNNSKNPVINSRSFGENRDNVVRKALMYYNGMQDGGVIGCIKHFPGHGDTETDSHLGLPVIKKSRIELDELELYPFRQLIDENVDMVMVGHLNIPALDSTANSVSSISFPIVSELLKRDYGYSGMIITDGMEMQGLQKKNRFEGDVEIQALLAGVDILLLPGKTENVVAALKTAVDSGILPVELINERCLRVLQYKESKGLFDYSPVDIAAVPRLMNTQRAANINEALEQHAVTLLKNEDNILPLVRLPNDTLKADSIVFLCVGRPEYQKQYREIAAKYGLVYIYQEKTLPGKGTEKACQSLIDTLAPYNRVILAYGGSNQLPAQKYGVDNKVIDLLNQIAKDKRVVFLHLGNPYVLNAFGTTENYKALMVTYQSTPNSVKTALEACFGERVCEGTLPVSVNEYPYGSGITNKVGPENISALPDSLTKVIDGILANGIKDKVYPGCVMLAMQDGKVLYHKGFGYYTYNHQNKVTTQTMYDVASVTKTAATTLAVMKLYDEGKIKLTDHIGDYLDYLQGTNKAHIPLAELLTHTSGMPAFIPFYTKIQGDERYLRKYKSPNFGIKVADNLYLRNDYPDTMRYEIAHCNLGHHQYVYSDLNMVMLKDMVEKVMGCPIEDFLRDSIYAPMGLTHTCFNPLSHGFTKAEIAPTEKDTKFRKQVVQGYVHDQTAALFSGNAGDAGLFTTAEELGKIYQMLLDGGVYQGRRYFSELTVRLFTSAYEIHGSKVRGLGFYTPKHPGSSSIVPAAASTKIFGHQGFTGTVVWCDPDNKLIYVFLSNRVYPDCYPNKLSSSKIRLKAHEVLY